MVIDRWKFKKLRIYRCLQANKKLLGRLFAILLIQRLRNALKGFHQRSSRISGRKSIIKPEGGFCFVHIAHDDVGHKLITLVSAY